jgi:hypothetical protein
VTTTTATRPLVVHRLPELERPARLAIELADAQAHLPIGTLVTYWPGFNTEVGRKSFTRSEVWRLPSGQLVAMVDGYAGGIALTHITRLYPHKRSDVVDGLVLKLAAAWKADPEHNVGVVSALVASGVPAKLARAKVEHLIDRGLLECGVSADYAWPVEVAP